MHRIGTTIRLFRERQGLSQRALAEAAGISAAALSQLESGQSSPSVATLEKLADGLGVAIAAFFLEPRNSPDVEIFDLDERPSVRLAQGGRFVPLTSTREPVGFEPMLVQLEAGGCFDEHAYGIQSSHVFAWMRKGKAVLEYNGNDHELSETQSIYYDARKPHNWHNRSESSCEILMVRSR